MTTTQMLIAFTIIAACGLPIGLFVYALFYVLKHMDVEVDEDTL